MPTNVWRGTAPTAIQVVTATPANVEVGDVFTLTLTDDAGDTVAVSYTAAAATVADVCAGLAAAWLAATDPRIREIVASDDETHVTLSAQTAGRPFALAASTANGGSVDDQTLTLETTLPSSGPHDYGLGANWTRGVAPEAGDTVVIPAGTPAILYGLNASAVAIGACRIAATANIGRSEAGRLYHLRIDPTALHIAGTAGLVAVDVGSAAIAPLVEHDGAPAGGGECVHLRGSALAGLDVRRGYVGLATWPGVTATVSSGGYVHQGGGRLVIGHGATIAGVTVRKTGGDLVARKSVPTCDHWRGTFRQEEAPWGALTLYGGDAYPNAAGEYGTTEVRAGARLRNIEDLRAKSFPALTLYSGGQIEIPRARLATPNGIETPDGDFVGVLDIGSGQPLPK